MLGLGLRIEPAEVAIAFEAEGSAQVKWTQTASARPFPQAETAAQAMRTVPPDSDSCCFAEWRQLTLGGKPAYVAVVTEETRATDVRRR